jgi:hypothetical protein
MSFTGCLERERLVSVLLEFMNLSDFISITLQIDSVTQENVRSYNYNVPGEPKHQFRGYH